MSADTLSSVPVDFRSAALFGGSFDPVHAGHLAIARAAREQAGIDRVIFLPAARSPFKENRPAVTAEERLTMLRLAVEGGDGMEVSDWELRREPPNYSWETAEHFTASGPPGTRWHWLMGADQWEALDRWARPDRLAELVTFLVFARDGVTPRTREGFRAKFLRGEFTGSSTQVRESLAKSGDADGLVGPAWLPLARRIYGGRTAG